MRRGGGGPGDRVSPERGLPLIFAEAPSNIALIKYMGKLPTVQKIDPFEKNRATNSSLSVTLDQLLTRVEILPLAGENDRWEGLTAEGWQPLELSAKGQERFLAHFAVLKEMWKINGFYLIRSANNFPSDCGLASSASSFAALTAAAARLAESLNPGRKISLDEVAEASRTGSGSSIRSFYRPFAIWKEDRAFKVPGLRLPLVHQVVVVEDEKKQVSSSEAHKRVLTSPLFEGRVERAEARLNELVEVLQSLNERPESKPVEWKRAFQICWDEFHDMHALFSTSSPPFSYWRQGTDEVVNWAEDHWRKNLDGPIVTMDAGANVHFLTRQDQGELRDEIRERFSDFVVFGDEP